MKLSIIVAKAQNGVIGSKGELPWTLPLDLAHFKRQTTGHPIIMGRKTYESIGRPLPGRLNIVITKDQREFGGVKKARSLAEAIDIAYKNHDEAYVIGGSGLYQVAIPWATHLVITEVKQDFEGDTYFPHYNRANWAVLNGFQPELDNGIATEVTVYERIKEETSKHVVFGGTKFTEMDVFNAQMAISVAMANAAISKRARERQTKNSYELAVEAGFQGTQFQFMYELTGPTGTEAT